MIRAHLFCCKNNLHTLFCRKNYLHTFCRKNYLHTFFCHKKEFTHLFLSRKRFTRFFVAKTIYALRPENFCALKVAIRKVQTFWASGVGGILVLLLCIIRTDRNWPSVVLTILRISIIPSLMWLVANGQVLQDLFLFFCFLSVRFQEMTSTTESVNFIRCDEFLRGATTLVQSAPRQGAVAGRQSKCGHL